MPRATEGKGQVGRGFSFLFGRFAKKTKEREGILCLFGQNPKEFQKFQKCTQVRVVMVYKYSE
jgi:hypothetical protein